VDRRRLIVGALSVPWGNVYAAQASIGVDASVLFVGNSITAANDLPAVFFALAAAYGRRCRTQELLRPGAPLDAFVADGSLELRLQAEQFSHVILQERGGDYLCAFGPASCEIALRALSAAAGAVRQTGASPLRPAAQARRALARHGRTPPGCRSDAADGRSGARCGSGTGAACAARRLVGAARGRRAAELHRRRSDHRAARHGRAPRRVVGRPFRATANRRRPGTARCCSASTPACRR